MNASPQPLSIALVSLGVLLGGCTSPDEGDYYGRRAGTVPAYPYSLQVTEDGYQLLAGTEIQYHFQKDDPSGGNEWDGAGSETPAYRSPQNAAIISFHRKAGESDWKKTEFWNFSETWNVAYFWLPGLAAGRGPMLGYFDQFTGSLKVQEFREGDWRAFGNVPLSGYQIFSTSRTLAAVVDPDGGLWVLFAAYVASETNRYESHLGLRLRDPEGHLHTVAMGFRPTAIDLGWSGERLWVGLSEVRADPRNSDGIPSTVPSVSLNAQYRLAAWKPSPAGDSAASAEARLSWDTLTSAQAHWLKRGEGDWEIFLPDHPLGPAFYHPSEKRLEVRAYIPGSTIPDESALKAWNGTCLAFAIPPPSLDSLTGKRLPLSPLASSPLRIANTCGDSIGPLIPAFDLKEDSLNVISPRYRLEWNEDGRLRVLTVGEKVSLAAYTGPTSYGSNPIPETEVVLSTWMDTVWTHETVHRTQVSSP